MTHKSARQSLPPFDAASIISGAISKFPGAIYQFYANDDGTRGFHFFSEGVEKFIGFDVPVENAYSAIMARVHPDDIESLKNSIEETIRSQAEWHHEARYILPNGKIAWIEAISTPMKTDTGIVFNGLLRDTTEQHLLREAIIQTEKMMSIGGLAAGMAHEINNPLAGLMQSIQVLKQRLNSGNRANQESLQKWNLTPAPIEGYFTDRKVYRILESMSEACNRVSTIVQDMLSFARNDRHTYSEQDMANLLDQTLNIASTDYNLKKKYDFKQIRLYRDYDPFIPYVECIPSELQQVFINILKNGAQAMYDTHASRGITSKFFLKIEYCEKDDAVLIEIADNGPGVPDHVRSRIFEPFFSTKNAGCGTGLGLSVSYFIITKTHKGSLSLSTHPASGACFQIRLPRTQRSDTPKAGTDTESH